MRWYRFLTRASVATAASLVAGPAMPQSVITTEIVEVIGGEPARPLSDWDRGVQERLIQDMLNPRPVSPGDVASSYESALVEVTRQVDTRLLAEELARQQEEDRRIAERLELQNRVDAGSGSGAQEQRDEIERARQDAEERRQARQAEEERRLQRVEQARQLLSMLQEGRPVFEAQQQQGRDAYADMVSRHPGSASTSRAR